MRSNIIVAVVVASAGLARAQEVTPPPTAPPPSPPAAPAPPAPAPITPQTPPPHEPVAPPAAEPAAADAGPKITVGGYIEAYYQLNPRLPSNRITNLRGFDNRDRSLTLSNVALDVKAERGPLVVHTVLQIGATGSSYYLAEPTAPGTGSVNASGSELWKYVQQANLVYTTASKIEILAGLFTSPIGPESLQVKDDWNWSRSNLFFGLPFYHAGVHVGVPLGGDWTGMVHVCNGWNDIVDSNGYPSIAVSAAYGGKKVNGQVLYFGGIERAPGAPEGKPWRNLLDAYATVTVTDDVSVMAEADAGVEPNDLGTSSWLAGALYGKYQLAPKWYAAARGDYFREWVPTGGASIFWPTPWLASGTATLAMQPIDGLSVRLEYRHDQGKDRVFFGGDVSGDGSAMMPYVPNRRAQDTFTLGAVAWF